MHCPNGQHRVRCGSPNGARATRQRKPSLELIQNKVERIRKAVRGVETSDPMSLQSPKLFSCAQGRLQLHAGLRGAAWARDREHECE